MNTKQKVRAESITKCLKKQRVINLIRLEKMIDKLKRFYEIEYYSHPTDHLKYQMLNIELDFLKLDLLRGKINFFKLNGKLQMIIENGQLVKK